MAARVEAMSLEPRVRSVDRPGHVFGRLTTIALVLLLGLAAWLRQPAVVTLLGLTLATIGVARGWSRLSLRRVRCERTFSTASLFPDEELLITTRLSNQKPLPLPWVEVDQYLPPPLLSQGDGGGQRDTLSRSLSMPWYSRLTWRQSLRPRRRGCYFVPPLTITSGDIFGLYPRVMEAGTNQEVVIYPRLYPVRRLPLQRTDASGELTGRLVSLHEDPTRMRGIRDYQPQDGMRRLHWKASARRGELKVRLYEPSALSRVNLVLCADGFDEFTDGSMFELAASAVASVGCYCIERQMQVGFLSNASLVAGEGTARLAPGSGSAQLTALLELLARVTPSPDAPMEHLADELRRLALSGSAIIAVVNRIHDGHAALFAALAAKRCPILVLAAGESRPGQALPFACGELAGPDGLLDLGVA